MSREEAILLLNYAIDQVVQHESALLQLGVTERALSHQVARYMADRVKPPLSVDCEYNRHFGETKRLNLQERGASDHEVRAVTVFPDVIVHERNSDERNLLVVELKKPGEDLGYDERKLKAYRSQLGYQHGAHLILGLDFHGGLIRQIVWVDL